MKSLERLQRQHQRSLVQFGDERESHWMARVLDLLEVRRWTLRYHTYDSTKSVAGFPDIIALRLDRGLALECKTEHARPARPEQRAWLDGFARIPGFVAREIRPSDWPWLMEVTV